MAELDLEPGILPPLRDVDTYDVALRGGRRGAAHALRRRAGRVTGSPHDRRRPPLLRRPPLRPTARVRARRDRPVRARGSGSPTGGSSRSRSTAGWRPPTPSTRRSSPTSRRRCSTSAAARAGISPRCGRSASAASASISPRSPWRSPATAAPTAINGSLWASVPGAVADDPAAGRQHRHRRRRRRAAPAGGELLSAARRDRGRDRPAGRADAPRADPDRGAGPGLRVVPRGRGWASTARTRSRSAPGSRSRRPREVGGRTFVTLRRAEDS